MKYDYIIWDFNGTIIDDRKLCLDILNKMLKERDLKTVNLAEYREVFGFPIINYYKKVGFDFTKEDFSIIAVEFVDQYQKESLEVGLVKGSLDTIKALEEKGYNQIVISASEINNLKEQLDHYNLSKYFQEVIGLSDVEAASKTSIAIDWLESKKNKNLKLLMVGDSLHDFEVAQAIGAECILIDEGSHQSKRRLEETGCKVLNNSQELLKIL